MANLSVLLGTKKTPTHFGYQDDKKELHGILQLDASIKETHNLKATISSIEIEKAEDGTNKINDNVVFEPESLQIEGFVSEAPISLLDSLTNVGAGLISNVSPAIGAVGAFLSTELMNKDEDRQQNALKQLIGLWKSAIPFTVVTGLRRYENMLITNINLPVDTRLGKSLRFTIDMIKVKLVESKTVLIPKARVKSDAQHSASTKQDVGKQGTTEASEQEAERGSSVLSKLTGFGI